MAAAQVLVFHTQWYGSHTVFGVVDLKWFLNAANGDRAVMLFFVLSGFLMGHLYLNTACTPRSVVRYALARVSRVVPLYLVGLGLSNAALVALPAAFIASQPSVFTHLWTVPVELQYYVVFVGVWAVARAVAAAQVAVALAAVAVYAAAALKFFCPWLGEQLPETACDALPSFLTAEWYGCGRNPLCIPAYLPLFVWGSCLGANWRPRLAGWCASRPWLLGVVAPLALVGQLWPTSPLDALQNKAAATLRDDFSFSLDGQLLPPGDAGARLNSLGFSRGYVISYLDVWNWLVVSALVVGAANGTRTTRAVLEGAPLQWLGTVSFGVYVYHFVLRIGLQYALGASEVSVALYFSLPLALAWLSLRFFEQPVGRAIRGLGGCWCPPAADGGGGAKSLV